MSSASPSSDADVIWEGGPWVAPGLAVLTAEAVSLAVALSYVEVVWIGVHTTAVTGTLFVVSLLWLVGAAMLEMLAWSNHYTLRRSSLEVQQGMVEKRVFTVSAAGFSDLEVTRSIRGRIVNTGDIVVETDSHRDIALFRVRDPMMVSRLIRQVMTAPLVRVDGQSPLPAANGAIQR